jgi:hypothetical protein
MPVATVAPAMTVSAMAVMSSLAYEDAPTEHRDRYQRTDSSEDSPEPHTDLL